METLCRLCAEEKSPKQLTCSIDDQRLHIEQKLIDCCRWSSFIVNTEMPKMICDICFESLEQSWSFAEKVARAQEQLLSQLVQKKQKAPLSEAKVEPLLTVASSPKEEHQEPHDEFEDFNYDEPFSSIENDISSPATEATNNEYFETELEKAKIKMHSEQQQPPQETEKLSFLCEICGKDFSTRSNVLTHTKLHLPIENRKHFECYICKMKCSYKKSLIHHMPIHSGETIQYQCTVCSAYFSRTDALRRHSLIHLGKFQGNITPLHCISLFSL